MISFDKALEIVLSNATKLKTIEIPLAHSLNWVLARDVSSDVNIPAHNLSAMDGFACRRTDLDNSLRVIETIPAGVVPTRALGTDECSRIMTGAVVPPGADTVVMFEHTKEENNLVQITKKSDRSNIRKKAEDIKKGDVVLKDGKKISPVEIAILASVGCDPVPVYNLPRVGVIATGDELVEPQVTPKEAQIRNTNSYQVCTHINKNHFEARYFGIAKDDPKEVDYILKAAFEACDVVVFSGGVSAGDFDYVPGVLQKNSVDILFQQVSVKPGKPTVFGVKNGKFFFGLPGNPVSTFVLFEMLVKPFLFKLMGMEFKHRLIKLPLAKPFTKKKVNRQEFIPIRLVDGQSVAPLEYHGSAHIYAYSKADGIISIPPGVTDVQTGEIVDVIFL